MNSKEKLENLLNEMKCYGSSIEPNIKSVDNSEIADYLVENNVIVPSLKIGDIVYRKYSATNTVELYIVDVITYYGDDEFKYEAHLEDEDGYTVDVIVFGDPDIGLTVFLNEDKAKNILNISECDK